MTSKALLRAEVRARLQSLSSEARATFGLRIEQRVWSLPELAGARTLLLYASMPSEVPTDAIAAEARRRGLQVAYPRCLPDRTEMTLHSVTLHEHLRPTGSYGLREPGSDCPVVGVEDIDVAFLPGLAWDRSGHRLGRGAGYYDRLLANPAWRALRCGLFFSIQEVTRIPADPWDHHLDRVITETEVLAF